MSLGEKVKQARLERGLSQRQVCGDVISRNMLSLIESGAASPSLQTLHHLSAELGKPISFFLDEQVVASANQTVMEQARQAWAAQEPDCVIKILSGYQSPDTVYDSEAALLRVLSFLAMAEKAVESAKIPYAVELLNKARTAGEGTYYYTPELERRCMLALAELTNEPLSADDRELLYRAEKALREKNYHRAGQYLDATEEHDTSRWCYLKGQCLLACEDYAGAKECFERGWDQSPRSCAAYLEQCCRELEDFRGAYHYACLLREI